MSEVERTKYKDKKRCKKCGKFKPLSDYCRHNQTKDRRHIYCKECRTPESRRLWKLYWEKNKVELLQQAKEKREKDPVAYATYRRMLHERNPDINRNHWYKSKYKISLIDYKNMYNQQNGICPICSKYYNKLSIDHDHNTKKVRGLLCRDCNIGLGLFRDNINSLQNAVKYLQNGK